MPEAVERALARFGRKAGALVDDVQLDPAVSSSGAQADRGSGWGGLDRVREKVVEHLLDPTARLHGRAVARPTVSMSRLLSAASGFHASARAAARAATSIASAGSTWSCGRASARSSETSRDEAVGLGHRSGERLAPGRRDVPFEVLEPQAQRCQRCPQLVRRVRDEVFLRVDERLELRRSLVQRAGKTAYVVRPVALGSTRIELTVADPLRRALDAAQRPRDGTREQQAEERGGGEHDGGRNAERRPSRGRCAGPSTRSDR